MSAFIYVLIFILGVAIGSAFTFYRLMKWVRYNPDRLSAMASTFAEVERDVPVKSLNIEFEDGKYFAYEIERGTFLGYAESLEILIEQIGDKFPEYDLEYSEPNV